MKEVKMAKYEGSKADMKADKRNAKKAGMNVKKWEKSAADKKEDAKGQKKLDARKKK
jgi:hypothetical protein